METKILNQFAILSLIICLDFTVGGYAQENHTYQLSIKDENSGEIGQYFDLQIDNVAIASDTTLNFHMIPNLGIQNSTLKQRYSTFLELLMRVINKDSVVGDQNALIGDYRGLLNRWQTPIHYQVIVPDYPTHVEKIDAVIADIDSLFESPIFIKHTNSYGQNPKLSEGWNFDYRWGTGRYLFNIPDITKLSVDEFNVDGTPKLLSFDMIPAISFTSDLQERVTRDFLKGLFLNKSFDTVLVLENGRLSPDAMNILKVVLNLSPNHNFAYDSNEANRSPIAVPIVPSEGLALSDITITSASIDPDGQIVNESWEVYNGDTSDDTFSILNPNSTTAVFRATYPGVYRIKLTAMDDGGRTSSTEKEIIISEAGSSQIEIKAITAVSAYWDPNLDFDTAREHFSYMKNEMNANWISINTSWWLSDTGSTVIHPIYGDGDPRGRTMPEDTLETYIQFAIEHGFNIMLRPLIGIYQNAPISAGQRWMIRPTQAFFQDSLGYNNFLSHHAEIAEKYRGQEGEPGIKLLSVQGELSRLTEPDGAQFWIEQATEMRGIYKGQLTSGQHFTRINSVLDGIPWQVYDIISISAYWPLATSNDASTLEMYNTFKNLIETKIRPVSDQFNKPFIFAECGYPNRDGGASSNPDMDWVPFTEADRDDEEQKRAIDAIFRNIVDLYRSGDNWFKGVFWWQWLIDNDDAEQQILNDFAHLKIRWQPVQNIVKANYK